ELVDNGLDAGVGVAIRELRGGTVEVVDRGEGITGSDEEIARRFSIARPLSSTKLRRMPTRGAMGNGLRVVAGAVLASGGSLEVATCGRALTLAPQDDGTTAILGSKPDTGAG